MRPRAVVAWMAAILSLGLVLSGCGTPPPRLDQHSWKAYSDRFVTADGRVIDRDSGTPGITHTEGLGYGMLLAEAAEDRRGFELIWRWTREHLRRPDGLFSWRYGPCPTRGGDCVLDKNNASDGDILIAWALLRAGKAWGRSDYVDAARAIAAAVADTQIVRVGGTTLLLPGSEGFVDGNAVVVNPSYWIFPAFSAFAQAFEAPVWSTLSDSSLALLRQSRFGRWNLPPDWLKVQGEQLSVAPGFPPQYGFNAVRVPLHLVWGGRADDALLAPYITLWSEAHPGHVPAWVDLTTDDVAPYGWQTGMAAIAALVRAPGAKPEDLPAPGADDGYYSWSLALLSRVARAETAR